jgi:tRNA(Ile)-lysidine synthase
VTIERTTLADTDVRASERWAFLSAIRFPLHIRTRRPGDRMTVFGMRGRKKISDIFVDRKVPLHRRERIPVFEDQGGIVWIPGVATSERTRVDPGKRTAIRIGISRLTR